MISEIFTEAHKVNYFNFIGTSLPMHSFIVCFTSIAHTLPSLYLLALFVTAYVLKAKTLNTENIQTDSLCEVCHVVVFRMLTGAMICFRDTVMVR